MSYESADSAGNTEIEKILEDCLVAAVYEETTGIEWDLGNIACQRAVLEALNFEGVDVGYLTNTLDLHPDSSSDSMTQGYAAALDILRGSTSLPEGSKNYWITLFETQHRTAMIMEQVVWARRNIDDGADPGEAKVATQLEIYSNQKLPPDEKKVWFRVIDRIIPEAAGLDPTTPNTALEIEAWIKDNSSE